MKWEMMARTLLCGIVLLLWTAALQVCALNRGEFSATLEQAVIDLLGSEQYQVTSEIYSKLVTTSMANISV